MALAHHTLVAWRRTKAWLRSEETFDELKTDGKKTGAPLSGLCDRPGQARRV